MQSVEAQPKHLCSLLDGLVALGCIMHLCYGGCEGYGTANWLSQRIMELAEISHEHLFVAEAKMFSLL